MDIESNIVWEQDGFYVFKIKRNVWEVRIPDGPWGALSDSAYDDESIAIARCRYLHKRWLQNQECVNLKREI